MAYINGKKILAIIKGGGGSTGGDIAINTLNGTTWKIKDPFNTDKDQIVRNINFVSNNENFICLLYAPESGLFYIDENENIVTVFDETNSTWNANEAYRTLKITGGDDVEKHDAIGDIKYIATLIAVEGGGVEVDGTIDITENGTHDVSKYASANVNVASSGGSGKQFIVNCEVNPNNLDIKIPTVIMNKKQFTTSISVVIE